MTCCVGQLVKPKNDCTLPRLVPTRVENLVGVSGIAVGGYHSLAVVGGPIAEALFATGLGLIAAIPAVIFYNKL